MNEFISVTELLTTWFEPFKEEEAIVSYKTKTNTHETTEEIKEKWEKGRNEAVLLGTELHKQIEEYFKGNEGGTSIEYGYFLQFVKDVPLQTKAVEWTLMDRERRIRGTIDYASVVGNQIDLYDWKRSYSIHKVNGYCIQPDLKHIPDSKYWRYTLQLNLYKHLAEHNGYSVRKMFIVCLNPGNLGYQKYEVPRLELGNVLNSRRIE